MYTTYVVRGFIFILPRPPPSVIENSRLKRHAISVVSLNNQNPGHRANGEPGSESTTAYAAMNPQRVTPAMESGLADHVWTIGELVS